MDHLKFIISVVSSIASTADHINKSSGSGKKLEWRREEKKRGKKGEGRGERKKEIRERGGKSSKSILN